MTVQIYGNFWVTQYLYRMDQNDAHLFDLIHILPGVYIIYSIRILVRLTSCVTDALLRVFNTQYRQGRKFDLKPVHCSGTYCQITTNISKLSVTKRSICLACLLMIFFINGHLSYISNDLEVTFILEVFVRGKKLQTRTKENSKL